MATRSNAKQLLIAALNNDFLAEGFTEFLQTPLPEFDNDALTTDEAFQWEGKLSRYLCQVFALFEGLYPMEIPLRMGQRNATQQAMLLASLQATRTVSAYYDGDWQAEAEALWNDIETIAPTPDGYMLISKETLQDLSDRATVLAHGLNQDADDVVKGYINTLVNILQGLVNTEDDPIIIAEDTWRNLKSVGRALIASFIE